LIQCKQVPFRYCQVFLWVTVFEGVSKSLRTSRLERELQMIQHCSTRCSCVAILWVTLVSFVAKTLCVASQRVFIVVDFIMIKSGNFWIHPCIILWNLLCIYLERFGRISYDLFQLILKKNGICPCFVALLQNWLSGWADTLFNCDYRPHTE